jgi:DNA-binding NtrC family response regulator
MTASGETILICDDDEVIVELYSTFLEGAGWTRSLHCPDSRDVMPTLRANDVSAILLDLYMPHLSGRDLLQEIVAEFPEIPVIILTLEEKIDVAVECMKDGAFDFMTKPVDENRLINSVAHAIRVRELQDEVRVLSRRHGRGDLSDPAVFDSIVTNSDIMMTVFAYVEAVARSPKAVLITGESGTGKELVARSVHDASGRTGQFVAVNVSGLDDTVFSDTLFGHRRGAFTGADSVRKGLIEQAAQGTLFLDEIGDLDNAAQVKLLRLLQEGEYYALGSDTPGRSTARIVAATNADLHAAQSEGRFRKDLFYRLMSHHVRIPPLRERLEDLPLLLNHFVTESSRLLERDPPAVPPRIVEMLRSYPFPGNVRELQSLVHDAASTSGGGSLSVQFFADYIAAHRAEAEKAVGTVGPEVARDRLSRGVLPQGARFAFSEPFPTLQEVEDFLIEEALSREKGNQTAAARLLGISQSTLSRRLSAGK